MSITEKVYQNRDKESELAIKFPLRSDIWIQVQMSKTGEPVKLLRRKL